MKTPTKSILMFTLLALLIGGISPALPVRAESPASPLQTSGDFVWARNMGGANGDGGKSITVDSSGNVYTNGTFGGTADFDPGPGTTTLTSAGVDDIFISKLNNSGSLLWARRMGGTSTDNANSVATDSGNNVYTTGSFQGTVDFDPGTGTTNLTSLGASDIFISKLDTDGNFIWARNIGGTNSEAGLGIAIDGGGNIYTTGYFSGTVDFDPGADKAANLTSTGNSDIFVVKLNNNGNLVWARKMGGTSTDYGNNIVTDSGGNVYTTGSFQGTADFDPSAGTNNLVSTGESDIFVSKLNSNGNFVWTRKMGGASSEAALDIAIDSTGNIHTTGYFSGTSDFDPGTDASNLISAGQSDIFLSKLNSSGNFLWAKRMGGTGADYGNGISADSTGNIYTTGNFEGTADFDPGVGGINLTSAGGYDIFVSRLDSNGNFGWAKRMGGSNGDQGYGIALDIKSNVHTTGYFYGTVDFDPGAGTTSLNSAGSGDIFVSKLENNGSAPTSAVITVTSILDNIITDGYCSLREAIINANNNAATWPDCSAGIGADAIIFSDLLVIYTITLGSTLPEISDIAGLTIYGDDTFTISGNNLHRVFIVGGSASLTLDGLTVINGRIVSGFGGGVFNAGTLTIVNCLFSGNSSVGNFGGGIAGYGIITIIDSIFSNNSATVSSGVGGKGGGIYFAIGSTATITRTIFSGNSAKDGGGIYVYSATATITDSIINGNSSIRGGGIFNDQSTVTITHSTISNNSASSPVPFADGGGIYSYSAPLTNIVNSTFSNNSATGLGGGISVVLGTAAITNSTFSANSAGDAGGGLHNDDGTITIRNSTFSGNSAINISKSGGIMNEGSPTLNLYNTILANSANGGDCDGGGTTTNGYNNLIESSIHACGLTNGINGNIIGSDPALGPATLVNPIYFPLDHVSPAIDSGADSICTGSPVNSTSQNGLTRPRGRHCDIGAYEFEWPSANINVTIGGAIQGTYLLAPGSSQRVNYAGLDSGPVKVVSTNAVPIIAAIRDAWQVNGITTSFAEFMGLPSDQVSDTYFFPAYNNVTLDEQLRIGNVDTESTTVTVTIGGVLRGTYDLDPDEAVRISYNGLDSGPVVVKGTDGVDIIAAIREAWAVNGVTTSFVQLMGLPDSQLSDKYFFPAYNNVILNEQLRIGNVDTVATTVTVTIGGIPQGSYDLDPDEAVRINYDGLDSGPVVVDGTDGVDIIAAIRDAWAVNGVTTSFSQLMGMPAGGLSDTYIFPAYNNVTLNEQLRIGNVDTVPTTVTVTIGGVLQGSYDLDPDEAVRINYAGLDSGPVVVQGTDGVDIIAAIREAWAVNGVTQSFIQLMGLPFEQLSTTYLFPAYNNVTLNEQLRFAVP